MTYQIFLLKPGSAHELTLDNVRLIPGARQEFSKIIDAARQVHAEMYWRRYGN